MKISLTIAISLTLSGIASAYTAAEIAAESKKANDFFENKELTPKEIGLYPDPYSDFGRLSLELWRAGRLVVDTGIHSIRWTREQAIDYLIKNTSNTQTDCTDSINRYIVMPSQATAYKVGMLKILELREQAKKTLGDKFDIRQFHEAVLGSGSVPLDVLEELVDRWIKSKQAN
jgi:uncharacterized protein (DUF885 family)